MSIRQRITPDPQLQAAVPAAQLQEAEELVAYLRQRAVSLNTAVRMHQVRIAELEREVAELKKPAPKAAKKATSRGPRS